MEPKVKVLSVRQPYASAIIRGLKTVEFRSWSTDYRGPLLIHAGSTVDATEAYPEVERLTCPRGAIIGLVELTDCVEIFADEFDWILENPRSIEPIPCRGQLRLWTPASEILMLLSSNDSRWNTSLQSAPVESSLEDSSSEDCRSDRRMTG